MKRFILFLAVIFVTTTAVSAQGYVIISEGPSQKILNGIISRALIEKDSSYSWFAQNLKGYTPNSSAVESLREFKDSIQLLVFMGTWCDDSHFIIPKFFALTDASGFPQDRITLIGVDRQKKTLGHLTDALNIRNVPTIMVMKNGKELGRVVEYGKFGMFDKEVGDIIRAAFKP